MPAPTNALDLNVVWDHPDSEDKAPGASSEAHEEQHWTSCTRAHICLYLLLPMAVVAAVTGCVRHFDLDIRISRLFFNAEAGQFGAEQDAIWLALYHYGPIPGLTLGIGSTVAFAGSFVWRRLRPFREGCAFMALMLALGPGLIVNGILKGSWDRPRPCELHEFGGSEAFVPVLNLRIIGDHLSKSFPSGHASIGFYLLAPAFVLTRKSRRWTIAFLVLGLSLGLAMGLGRVAQGRHFPSDVLWSGAIVYFTGLLLAYILHPSKIHLRSETIEESTTGEERVVLRIEEHRREVPHDIAAGQSTVRDAPRRRVA